ncbi:MAG: hypothetical protein ACTSRG_26820, partial [Candidatus Helarchaeota archaeon]
IHWQDLILNPNTNMFQDYSTLLKINCGCPFCSEFRKQINENFGFEESMYNYYALNHNLYIYNKILEAK